MTFRRVVGDGAIGDGKGTVEAVDTAAYALVAGGRVRRNIVRCVVVDGGIFYLYSGVLNIDAAATGTSVIQNLGIGNSDMALVRNENAAACAKRHISTVLADLSGLIILNGAVVDGNILAVLDVNAAALFALVFLDGQVLQQNVGVPSVLDGNAAVGAAGDGTINDLYLLRNGSLAVLAGGSVVLLLGQVHLHVAFDLLAIQVQLDPLGNFDIARVVLLQDDLITGLGILQSIVQGAIAFATGDGGRVLTDSVLRAVHGGDVRIRVLDQVVYVRLRRDRGDLRRGRGDLRRGLLFHHSVLSGGDLHRGLLLFLGSFLCGGQFHCDGGCFRSGRLRSGLCSGLSFRLFLCRQFGFRGFLRVGLGMINGSRSLYVGCVFRGLSVGGQRGGCHTGGQGQSHGGFFEFLVRHKIRSFRSAHKRYHKLYLFVDKCPH